MRHATHNSHQVVLRRMHSSKVFSNLLRTEEVRRSTYHNQRQREMRGLKPLLRRPVTGIIPATKA